MYYVCSLSFAIPFLNRVTDLGRVQSHPLIYTRAPGTPHNSGWHVLAPPLKN